MYFRVLRIGVYHQERGLNVNILEKWGENQEKESEEGRMIPSYGGGEKPA